MKKIAIVVFLLMMFTQISTVKAEGLLYTESIFPVDTAQQTANSSKMGEGTCYNVLGLVEWGNCGLQAAMKNGKMSQIHHYDIEKSGWIFFKKITTQVYGY